MRRHFRGVDPRKLISDIQKAITTLKDIKPDDALNELMINQQRVNIYRSLGSIIARAHTITDCFAEGGWRPDLKRVFDDLETEDYEPIVLVLEQGLTRLEPILRSSERTVQFYKQHWVERSWQLPLGAETKEGSKTRERMQQLECRVAELQTEIQRLRDERDALNEALSLKTTELQKQLELHRTFWGSRVFRFSGKSKSE